MSAVFYLAALFAILSIISVALIPAHAIDDRVARAIQHVSGNDDQISGFRALVECKPLLILAATLLMFHLGNSAMLPLYGVAVVTNAHANGASFVAITIVVAQGVMILASLLAAPWGKAWIVGRAPHLLAALPIRGILAAVLIGTWGVYPVQFLDGVGAGLQSVAVPSLVVRILNGTGQINTGQGAVMTAAQGIGASLSPLSEAGLRKN